MFNIFKKRENIRYSIIDNFLPEEDFNAIKHTILSKSFPWYLNPTKVKDPERWRGTDGIKRKSRRYYNLVDKYNYQLFHMFAKDNIKKSEHLDVLNPIFNKLEADEKVRVKANLTPRTHKLIDYDFHRDTKKDCYTSVFYINKNNGYTLFGNGEKVASEPNRIVIFKSNEIHAGSSCTNSQVRVVININFTSGLTFI